MRPAPPSQAPRSPSCEYCVPIAHFDLSPCSLTVCGHHSAQYWPAYNAADQSPAQVPWKGTQIAYYFVTVTSATGFTVPTDQPASDIKAFVSQAKANGVKPVFSLGGWSGSIHFSSLVDSGTKRASLASKVQAFMTKWGFEGVDLGASFTPVPSLRRSVVPPSLSHSPSRVSSLSRLPSRAVPLPRLFVCLRSLTRIDRARVQTGSTRTASALVRLPPRRAQALQLRPRSRTLPVSPSGCNAVNKDDSAHLLSFLKVLRMDILIHLVRSLQK